MAAGGTREELRERIRAGQTRLRQDGSALHRSGADEEGPGEAMAAATGPTLARRPELKRPGLERRFQFQMVAAVDRPDVDAVHLVILQHIKGNAGARAALRPELAIEIGEIFRLLAIDADDHVSALDSGLFFRTARRDPAAEQPPAPPAAVGAAPGSARCGPVPV